VDKKALKSLVDWHVEEGSHGLVPVGTTGESPTLSHSEHMEVVELVIEYADGRLPIIAGTGSNNTAEAIELTQHAAKAGAAAALVVTPYYNKPTQAGLLAHYKALHDCAEIPIIIYNIPSRSVIDISVETFAELAKLPRIIGVKAALGHAAHGGVGCISVTGNVAPRLCAEFQNALCAGDWAKAQELQDRLLPLHEAIFKEPGLIGAKVGLSILGKCSDELRLPHVPAEAATKTQIESAMRFAGLIN